MDFEGGLVTDVSSCYLQSQDFSSVCALFGARGTAVLKKPSPHPLSPNDSPSVVNLLLLSKVLIMT